MLRIKIDLIDKPTNHATPNPREYRKHLGHQLNSAQSARSDNSMHQELMEEGDKEFVKEKQWEQESTMVKEETVEYVEGYSIAPGDEGKIALASGANQRNPDMDKSTRGRTSGATQKVKEYLRLREIEIIFAAKSSDYETHYQLNKRSRR